MSSKLKLFISYTHADEVMKTELEKQLFALKHSGKIEVWQDRELMGGDSWDENIRKELNEADIVLLLISPDFINSQYIWDKELSVALERHSKGEARVIPIILRSCDWTSLPFASLQALPRDAKPVNSFSDKDEAYTSIAKSIRTVVDYLINNKQNSLK